MKTHCSLWDEASMISERGLAGTMFGTGRLLDDRVSYVYSGKNCRLLLMEIRRLPPVGEEESCTVGIGYLVMD